MAVKCFDIFYFSSMSTSALIVIFYIKKTLIENYMNIKIKKAW